MELPNYSAALELATTDALREWLAGDTASASQLAGICVDVDAYYGSAGLYLLTRDQLAEAGESIAAEPGDWKHSTYWDLALPFAVAFAAAWGPVEAATQGALDSETEAISRARWEALLRAATTAMNSALDILERDHGIRSDELHVLVAEHDEPVEETIARTTRLLSRRKSTPVRPPNGAPGSGTPS